MTMTPAPIATPPSPVRARHATSEPPRACGAATWTASGWAPRGGRDDGPARRAGTVGVVLPQEPITEADLDDYLECDADVPSLHDAKFGGEDLPGSPDAWRDR
jgi:hypothetical protein